MGSFKLTDLSESASPDGPVTAGYFFEVSLPGGRIGRAGVVGETYFDEPDDMLWRERVLARLNEMETEEGWNYDNMAEGLSDLGLLVIDGTVDPAERGPFPRPLSDVEKAVARRVLELDGVAELELLSAQLEAAVATAPCDCPCPTVSIEVDHGSAEPSPGRDWRPSARWERGFVSVSIACGWLTELEIDWYIGDAPLSFPPLTRIWPAAPAQPTSRLGLGERWRTLRRRLTGRPRGHRD